MKITAKGLAIGAALAAALLAGCGSAATGGHPASHAPTPAPTQSQGASAAKVKADVHAWVASGGLAALNKVSGDIRTLGPADAAAWAKVTTDARAARDNPMPRSIDPGGAYLKAMGHLISAGRAMQNGQVMKAMGELHAMTPHMAVVGHELKAAMPAMPAMP
jgi:hypothetical protein